MHWHTKPFRLCHCNSPTPNRHRNSHEISHLHLGSGGMPIHIITEREQAYQLELLSWQKMRTPERSGGEAGGYFPLDRVHRLPVLSRELRKSLRAMQSLSSLILNSSKYSSCSTNVVDAGIQSHTWGKWFSLWFKTNKILCMYTYTANTQYTKKKISTNHGAFSIPFVSHHWITHCNRE